MAVPASRRRRSSSDHESGSARVSSSPGARGRSAPIARRGTRRSTQPRARGGGEAARARCRRWGYRPLREVVQRSFETGGRVVIVGRRARVRRPHRARGGHHHERLATLDVARRRGPRPGVRRLPEPKRVRASLTLEPREGAAPRSRRTTPSTDAIARGSSEIAMRDDAPSVRRLWTHGRACRRGGRRAGRDRDETRDERSDAKIGLDARRARVGEEASLCPLSLPPSPRLSRLSIRARLCRRRTHDPRAALCAARGPRPALNPRAPRNSMRPRRIPRGRPQHRARRRRPSEQRQHEARRRLRPSLARRVCFAPSASQSAARLLSSFTLLAYAAEDSLRQTPRENRSPRPSSFRRGRWPERRT